MRKTRVTNCITALFIVINKITIKAQILSAFPGAEGGGMFTANNEINRATPCSKHISIKSANPKKHDL